MPSRLHSWHGSNTSNPSLDVEITNFGERKGEESKFGGAVPRQRGLSLFTTKSSKEVGPPQSHSFELSGHNQFAHSLRLPPVTFLRQSSEKLGSISERIVVLGAFSLLKLRSSDASSSSPLLFIGVCAARRDKLTLMLLIFVVLCSVLCSVCCFSHLLATNSNSTVCC
jgi:hypothetical protein